MLQLYFFDDKHFLRAGSPLSAVAFDPHFICDIFLFVNWIQTFTKAYALTLIHLVYILWLSFFYIYIKLSY